MSDYIKRDDALNIDFKIIVRAFENRKTTATNAVQAYADAIAKIPSEDVRPVVRGKWIWDDEGHHCSECWFHACGNTLECMDGTYRFCPSCGAEMEGE